MKFLLEVEIPNSEFELEYMQWFEQVREEATGYGKVTKCQLKDMPNPLNIEGFDE